MIDKSIRYLTIGDIHLGNRRNPTSNIIKNLDLFFNDYKVRRDLDFVFIAGDIFDSGLEFSSMDIDDIFGFIIRLMTWCSQSGIRLRILEGTNSHDRRQSKIFVQVANLIKATRELDYKYVQTLYIEKVEDLGLTILYVPDEWRSDNRVTLEEVKTLLKSHNLETVDIAIMHGAFEYQLPVANEATTHNQQEYEKLVKYYINIGHVHNFTSNGKVVAQGSFDRLTHGDEGKKGGTLTLIRPDGTGEFVFVPNKSAMLFLTYTVTGNDLDTEIDKLRKYLDRLPDNSNVRIMTKPDHPILSVLTEIGKNYPLIRITKKTSETEEVTTENNLYLSDRLFESITITRDNLQQQLLSRIDPIYHKGVSRIVDEIS